MVEEKLIEKRFVITLVAVLVSTFLVYAGKLNPANFEQIIVWVVDMFVVGGASDAWAKHYGDAKVKLGEALMEQAKK